MRQVAGTDRWFRARLSLCAAALAWSACAEPDVYERRGADPFLVAAGAGGAGGTAPAGQVMPEAPDANAQEPPGDADATVAAQPGAADGGAQAPASHAGAEPPAPPLSRVQLGFDETGAHVEQRSGPVVRFIAVGDTGTGDEHQKRVADAMERKCEQDGCDFVLLLGDNIYENGPAGLDDPQWQSKFEEPYARLELPFYPALGNHDVGTFVGSGYNPSAVPTEVGYTERSHKWKMPAAHYTVSAGDVGILVYDTTALYNHVVEQGDQHAWVDAARDALRRRHRWVLAAAHHTYVSNGEHGNAGAYAYLDFDLGFEVKQFVEADLCGQVDLLLTGHDHNRQWVDASLCGGTEVVVSGAGAKTRPLVGKNPTHFQSEALGFYYVVVDGGTLTGQFLDEHGVVSFERTLQQ